MSNKAKWRNYSKEEIEQFVKDSYSYRELAKKFGYAQDGGGTMSSLKKMVEELNLDVSHFKGQGWNRENYSYEIFQNDTPKKRGSALQPLIALRGRKCENCGATTWLGKPINLEVHHIDGVRTNNSLENLQLLCPNCHSYTDNFRRPKKESKISEEDFAEVLKNSKSIYQTLKQLGLTCTAGNYSRARKLIEKYKIEHLY